jgi:hypothetical protein
MSARRRPNFFLVGAMKAGTSSMHRYLSQHPEIFMSVRKEPRYSGFAPDLDSGSAADGRWFTRDLGDYLANFAAARDERIVGESSHVYLHSTKAAELIHEFAPDARILIMLRDPVQMIHSRHQQQLWMVREDIRDFAEALAAEDDRRAGRRLPRDAPYNKGLLYREACTMAPQVRRYLDVFGRDRVHVVVLEDLAKRPIDVYREVLEFLEVNPDFVPNRMEAVNLSKDLRSRRLQRLRLRLMHVGRVIRRRVPVPLAGVFSAPLKALRAINRRTVPRAEMSHQLEEELTHFFAPDVAELSELLGVDLSAVWPRFLEPQADYRSLRLRFG